MSKVNNRNTGTSCEIYSKLTMKAPERRHWRRSGVFIVNFEHISHLVLVFLWLILSRLMPAGSVLSYQPISVSSQFEMSVTNYKTYLFMT